MSSTTETKTLRKTALNSLHRRLGAKMVDFGGWDMPVEYPASGGLMKEHLAVRTAVGMFDVSHMGDILIRGPQALDAAQWVSMNDVSRLQEGQAQYSALLYPEGTFVDDVIVHKLGPNDYLLVINAGTREKDHTWVRKNVSRFRCHADDVGDYYTQIAIQGPKAEATLQKLTDVDLSQIKNYWFKHGTVCGLPNTLIARTGYTAEDGFEIYVPSDVATSERVWNEVAEAGKEFGILPCGLGARNTLRLEGKMALYGHEISDTINVWEATLDRFCKMEKGDFVGRSALEKAKAEGLKRVLVGLEAMDRGIPRDDYKVFDGAGKQIGYVTSGSYAPFLKKNIALAYVPPELSEIGTEVFVEIRSQQVKCKVVPTPFYKRPKKAA
ncbi:MAG TPA: glycine cleavage system aminomethyltransferase GcvT [Candidatus Angelobacter sp.]|nr:glycine cleavage system aminomethyltransferase GcvT [Candidatus Angelobacter sp.]